MKATVSTGWCRILVIGIIFIPLADSRSIIHSKTLRYIPQKKLTVSEPPPEWFGNGPNAEGDKKWTNKNWLKSRFHFSFAEYSNPRNTNFGVLRVMNDDLVQPKRGFGTHPHRNMEIVTYIIQGKLTHQDSMGTSESLGRGSVQFMTAGTGIRHSEKNAEADPLRFIQMWLVPKANGLTPNYGSMCGTKINFDNQWAHIVSSTESDAKTPVKINCEANIKVAVLKEKKSIEFNLSKNRQAYFLAMEGSPIVEGEFGSQKFEQHDAAELYGEEKFKISGPGHVLIVEMDSDGQGGRSDI